MHTYVTLEPQANERYQYANSIQRTFSREYLQDSLYQHHFLNFEMMKTKDEYVSWFFDTVKNTVLVHDDRILDNSHILLWGVHLRSQRIPENGDCSIPSSVSSALSLSHGCFRGSQYENCLVLGRGTSYESSHTWYDKNALAIGSTRGLLRERYDGSGFLIPFEFHATNQSISTSCTDTSASTSVTYNELRSYLDPYIVDYADSGT